MESFYEHEHLPDLWKAWLAVLSKGCNLVEHPLIISSTSVLQVSGPAEGKAAGSGTGGGGAAGAAGAAVCQSAGPGEPERLFGEAAHRADQIAGHRATRSRLHPSTGALLPLRLSV